MSEAYWYTNFHVYDDRGCDLLATSPETIRDIYDKYNDWILDYDRNELGIQIKHVSLFN